MWMNAVETGVRECVGGSGVRGWVVGEADTGRTGEREEIRLVRVLTWADDGRGDAPSVQRRRAFVLEEREDGEDRFGEG